MRQRWHNITGSCKEKQFFTCFCEIGQIAYLTRTKVSFSSMSTLEIQVFLPRQKMPTCFANFRVCLGNFLPKHTLISFGNYFGTLRHSPPQLYDRAFVANVISDIDSCLWPACFLTPVTTVCKLMRTADSSNTL